MRDQDTGGLTPSDVAANSWPVGTTFTPVYPDPHTRLGRLIAEQETEPGDPFGHRDVAEQIGEAVRDAMQEEADGQPSTVRDQEQENLWVGIARDMAFAYLSYSPAFTRQMAEGHVRAQLRLAGVLGTPKPRQITRDQLWNAARAARQARAEMMRVTPRARGRGPAPFQEVSEKWLAAMTAGLKTLGIEVAPTDPIAVLQDAGVGGVTVDFCGCTNEQLERGESCGQPQCPNYMWTAGN